MTVGSILMISNNIVADAGYPGPAFPGAFLRNCVHGSPLVGLDVVAVGRGLAEIPQHGLPRR